MPPAVRKTLRAEDEISHYRIVSPLGAGGMGEVYLAQDRTLERNVAIKVLPPDLVRSEERVRRFVLEAKSASSLSHPNIVTIYEIGEDAVRAPGEPPSAPVHFISMELVSGKTLSALIHEDRVDLRTLLGYLAQAAEGLSKAHAAGIVHRDLKPGNIMVSADGFAKVLDFGLAKLTEKRESGPDASNAPTQLADATAEGVVVGTAGYMSPEQVAGRTVDHRSDIFSFGCILYEAATRVRPFAAETGVETMHKILNEKPAPVEDLNPGAPAELRRLIRRCLAKSPDQRLQSMKDLALELREIVDEYDALSASATSASGGSGSGAAAALAPAKRGLPLPALVALVAVAIGGVALGAWGLLHGRGATSQPFQKMRMVTLTSRGDVHDCALSADGRYLAYIAGAPGQSTLRVRQVATGGDVEVQPASGNNIESPSFSPDGNYVFYRLRKADARNYSSLQQVPSLGGASQQRAFDVDTRATFSPDGKRVAFWRGVPQNSQSRLVVVDLDSGTERILATIKVPETWAGGPSWSPDGRRIAAGLFVPVGALHSVVATFDATNGRRQDVATLDRTALNEVAWLRDGTGLALSATDLKASLTQQVFLLRYPGTTLERVTNDFSTYSTASAAGGDEAIAVVRNSNVQNVWLASAAGGDARQLTRASSPEQSAFGLAAPDTATVVFSSPLGTGIQLWAVAAAGGEPHTLTTGPAFSLDATGANGGVYFNRLEPSGTHVWTVTADGTGLRQLTSDSKGEQGQSVSHDGRYLAYVRNEAPGDVRLATTADGHTVPFASNVSGTCGFSNDGTRLLLNRLEPDAKGVVGAVWTAYAVPGGAPVDSLRQPGDAGNVTWSPACDGICFNSSTDDNRNIFRMPFRGGAPVALTHFTDGVILFWVVSPDGTKIAIARRSGADTNVWVTEADGSRPVQVTRFSGQQLSQVTWLPDNRRLLVSAGVSSNDAVVIRDFR